MRALISKWEAENRGKQKKKRKDFEDKPLHVCVGTAFSKIILHHNIYHLQIET